MTTTAMCGSKVSDGEGGSECEEDGSAEEWGERKVGEELRGHGSGSAGAGV
jgi:hypothetical protein